MNVGVHANSATNEYQIDWNRLARFDWTRERSQLYPHMVGREIKFTVGSDGDRLDVRRIMVAYSRDDAPMRGHGRLDTKQINRVKAVVDQTKMQLAMVADFGRCRPNVFDDYSAVMIRWLVRGCSQCRSHRNGQADDHTGEDLAS